MRKRHFTLAEANSLISRVRPRIERMMQLSVHLRSSPDGHSAGTLTRNITPMPPGTPWMADPVIAAWQATDPEQGRALAACLYETLSHELQGIEALGAEVKDLSIGLTTFPSYLDGNSEVLLAWTVTEPEVRTYYAPHSGYRHRKPVEGRTFTAVRTPAGQVRE
ncbi:MAG: hypothetical protein JWN48_2036 [Myxococcaceae bacterium]|nr:hypothetical protein [Myxococcaceae bacterium]